MLRLQKASLSSRTVVRRVRLRLEQLEDRTMLSGLPLLAAVVPPSYSAVGKATPPADRVKSSSIQKRALATDLAFADPGFAT